MKEEEIKRLKEAGFSGFVTVERLNVNKSIIPDSKGVYVVLRKMETDMPKFLAVETGPLTHKGRAMNYSIEELKLNWVRDTSVVYIGKTDQLLRKRIRTYLSYGQGNDAAHRGGRAIWQLPESEDLVFAWKVISPYASAESLESEMIQQFKLEHSFQRPYANMRD